MTQQEKALFVREAFGLTQQEAANLCGVSLRCWQYWEKGERKMRSIYLQHLLRHFDEANKHESVS